MPRVIIKDGLWKKLPKSSKSIYLPLLKFVNKKDGLAYPSLHTLAIVSEVTEKTAGLGVKGLEVLPEFTKHRYITARGHIAYRYHIIEPPPDYKHSIYISRFHQWR